MNTNIYQTAPLVANINNDKRAMITTSVDRAHPAKKRPGLTKKRQESNPPSPKKRASADKLATHGFSPLSLNSRGILNLTTNLGEKR